MVVEGKKLKVRREELNVQMIRFKCPTPVAEIAGFFAAALTLVVRSDIPLNWGIAGSSFSFFGRFILPEYRRVSPVAQLQHGTAKRSHKWFHMAGTVLGITMTSILAAFL